MLIFYYPQYFDQNIIKNAILTIFILK